MRGIAILWVMLYHFVPLTVFNRGTYGVLLFFVISGYCIAFSAEESVSAWHFYSKRLGRLLPALIVCGAITTALKHAFPNLIDADRINSWFNYAYCLFGLPTLNVLQRHLVLPDGAYWSLIVEFQFYAVCFLFMLIGFRNHLMRAVCVTAMLHTITAGQTTNGSNDFFPFFVCGMAVSEIARGRVLEGIGGIVIAFGLDLYHLIFHFVQPNIPIEYLRTIFLWIATATVWAASHFTMNRAGRWLKPLAFIGLISYPLYLIHQDVGYMIIKWAGISTTGFGLLERAIALPACLILIAWLVYRLVERNTIKPLTTFLVRLVPAPPSDENPQLRGNAAPGPGIGPLKYLRGTLRLRDRKA
ncbi:MAG: acyltransferase [Bradyrhizobium sp.]|nr:acyltransferase [Pseudomonadota bacterium]MDE2242147.1 acyltransferase [Bradyrhizobium sp.]MDE2467866.1 acyltransferase [Bradyrhizobium sp.]